MTGTQILLDFEVKPSSSSSASPRLSSSPPPPGLSSPVTLNGMVYDILRGSGEWWAPWELCNAILSRYALKVSDSSITARLRDLRKPQYGGHSIDKRRREGSAAFEYRIGVL